MLLPEAPTFLQQPRSLWHHPRHSACLHNSSSGTMPAVLSLFRQVGSKQSWHFLSTAMLRTGWHRQQTRNTGLLDAYGPLDVIRDDVLLPSDLRPRTACHAPLPLGNFAALLQVAASPGPWHQGSVALRAPGLKQALLRRSLQCSAAAADAAAASQAAPSSNGALSRIVDIELKAEAEQSYLAVRPLHLMPYTGAIASVKIKHFCACPAPLNCA